MCPIFDSFPHSKLNGKTFLDLHFQTYDSLNDFEHFLQSDMCAQLKHKHSIGSHAARRVFIIPLPRMHELDIAMG